MLLKNKNILITGSADRLGKLIAIELSKNGANILIHYNKSFNKAKKTQQKILSYNVKAELFKADLRNINEIRSLISYAIKSFGKIDILINSASLFYATPINKININHWDNIINTNLRGPFFCCKIIGLHMVKNKGGKIINISDIGGIIPWKNYSIYCISKAALISMTKALAKELAPTIQVNAIAPGIVLPKKNNNQNDIQKFASKTLLNRIGSPSDIINCIKFIIESDFITGSIFNIDGGQLLKY